MTVGVENLTESGLFFAGWGAGGPWYLTCILAVLVAALINGVFFTIGYAINSANLKRYAQTEFLQLAATAVLIVVIVELLLLGSQFVADNFGGGINCQGVTVTDPIDAASCRTAERLGYFYKQYENVISEDNKDGVESFYHFSITLYGVNVFQGSWVESTYKTVETYHYIAQKIISIMISLNAQMFLLQYIKENMLYVFLPLGIILRTMHFTRGIGGFLIALSLSLYFIYPTVLFMMDAGYAPAPPVQTPSYKMEGVCNLPMFSGFSLGSFQQSTNFGRAVALSASISNIASFVSQVYVRIFYENMVAFAFALTMLRYGTTILGGEAGAFLNVMGRWV